MQSTVFINTESRVARNAILGFADPDVTCRLLTEWQLTLAFFETGEDPALLSGATFRFALKDTPTGSALVFTSTLTESTDRYVADFSSVDSSALRTLIGDQAEIEVTGEIEWTISSRKERVHFPVKVINAWNRPDDVAPDPVAEASETWLNARALRVDEDQSLTTPQKAQALENLGLDWLAGATRSGPIITLSDGAKIYLVAP